MKETSIQNKSLKNLLKVFRAWKEKKFVFAHYGEQYLQINKIGEIIERDSTRTSYDYYQTLKTILLELNVDLHNPEKYSNKNTPSQGLKEKYEEAKAFVNAYETIIQNAST